ncbi:Uncharacterised protein [Klebsiella pneumoniae]|nr:Uncharacterised protein [Klebsiella pneumoniae]
MIDIRQQCTGECAGDQVQPVPLTDIRRNLKLMNHHYRSDREKQVTLSCHDTG